MRFGAWDLGFRPLSSASCQLSLLNPQSAISNPLDYISEDGNTFVTVGRSPYPKKVLVR
jgi:hypothetical protein